MHIAVFDLGIGNLRSVLHALRAVAPQAEVSLTSNIQTILDSDRVVLPGQGAIGTWFHELRSRNLESVLTKVIEEKPLLGICVGMQALFDRSAEDDGVPGLGLFAGEVQHFSHFHNGGDHSLKIPQMGWNQVSQHQSHPLWHSIEDDAYFYFVHSYCANEDKSASTDNVYGYCDFGHEFIAAAGRDNVFAVQFHPEKSHDNGLQLLSNFVQWDGQVR